MRPKRVGESLTVEEENMADQKTVLKDQRMGMPVGRSFSGSFFMQESFQNSFLGEWKRAENNEQRGGKSKDF